MTDAAVTVRRNPLDGAHEPAAGLPSHLISAGLILTVVLSCDTVTPAVRSAEEPSVYAWVSQHQCNASETNQDSAP